VTASQPRLERLTTGSAAFDSILGGGFPVRSVNVIAGEPGSGKSLFALQALFHLARQGKKGLYLTTLSEPSLKLLAYAQQFTFFDEGLIDEGRVVFADVGSLIRGKNAAAALGAITSRVEREEPALIVIDSFKAVRDLLADSTASVRMFVYDVALHAAGWGATSLFIGEYTDEEIATLPEFAIADGIIHFTNRRHELRAVREVEIQKLRGADYVTGCHYLEIGDEGLEFFPRVRGPDDVESGESGAPERVSTGVAGLDVMLDGGLPRASATVVQGGTGTGKTLLGLQFLLEGARHGEPGVHFMLEETAPQLRGIAHGLGWDLPELERRGLLTLSYTSPVELSTDRFLDQARRQLETGAAKRAVLDSLTSVALGVTSERRFKELVYAITKHLRRQGVTFQMNLEIPDLLGSAQLSGHGISFAADNVIQLKYIEVNGHLERGLSVLKARGVRHLTDVRRLIVKAGGLEVGAPFEGMRGVLTGLPVLATSRTL
jgi:circadian clock protein KaiC